MDIEKTAMDGLAAATSHKASYCDIRYEIIRDENLSYSDGSPDPIKNSVSAGWAVRLLKDGAWGFASSDDPLVTIDSLVSEAAAIAQASSRVMKAPVDFPPMKAEVGEYISPCAIDPFSLSLSEKTDYLEQLDAAMGQYEACNSRSCFANFRKLDKWFFSSEGSKLHQLIIQSGAGMSMGQVKSRRERAERTYPRSSGQYGTIGFELLDQLDMAAQIPRLVEETTMLLTAAPCPEKTTTLVLAPDIVSLVIHESIGHALELDRVFGSERNFSGTSFATIDQLDSLRYASDIVTVTNDPTAEYALGTFGWDDEGVRSHESNLIKNGILRNYLSSRETAARIGKSSTGTMRAEGWQNLPLIRMTNTCLLPGDKTFEQLIGDVDEGIYMATPTSWSIDDVRKNFQFGCEIGWEIKGGKLAGVIKDPTFSGCTTQFWNNCDAIGDASQFKIWGTPNCGKGQPGQNARTGEGASAARFTQIDIGG